MYFTGFCWFIAILPNGKIMLESHLIAKEIRRQIDAFCRVPSLEVLSETHLALDRTLIFYIAALQAASTAVSYWTEILSLGGTPPRGGYLS